MYVSDDTLLSNHYSNIIILYHSNPKHEYYRSDNIRVLIIATWYIKPTHNLFLHYSVGCMYNYLLCIHTNQYVEDGFCEVMILLFDKLSLLIY